MSDTTGANRSRRIQVQGAASDCAGSEAATSAGRRPTGEAVGAGAASVAIGADPAVIGEKAAGVAR